MVYVTYYGSSFDPFKGVNITETLECDSVNWGDPNYLICRGKNIINPVALIPHDRVVFIECNKK